MFPSHAEWSGSPALAIDSSVAGIRGRPKRLIPFKAMKAPGVGLSKTDLVVHSALQLLGLNSVDFDRVGFERYSKSEFSKFRAHPRGRRIDRRFC